MRRAFKDREMEIDIEYIMGEAADISDEQPIECYECGAEVTIHSSFFLFGRVVCEDCYRTVVDEAA